MAGRICPRAGAHEGEDVVGGVGTGGEHLLAADDVVVPVGRVIAVQPGLIRSAMTEAMPAKACRTVSRMASG
jgi:hypothetical protein